MSPPNQTWTWQCDRVIANDTAVGRRLLDDLLGQLETMHWSRREIFGVHLAVDEALVNAIHHGNADDSAKHVQFSARVCPTRVRVEIVDEGPGFDPDRVPDPTAPDRLGRPGGRGVLLMRAFMSHVEFQDGGSHVVLEKERSV
ncbi:MAG: ATP-binding protein [Thermoguttaceae bacterium]